MSKPVTHCRKPLPKAILWDLDGTLIDQTAAIIRNFQAVVTDAGYAEPNADEIRRSLGMPMRGTMSLFIPDAQLDEACRAFRQRFPKVMYDGLIVLPGAQEILQAVYDRGIPQAIFTNKHGPTAREICGKLGWMPLLQQIIGSGDTPMNKPDPEYTAYVLAQMNVSRGRQVVMVGDSPTDIAVASGAGLTAWTVATGAHSRDELLASGAHRAFEDLQELHECWADEQW